MVELEGLEFQIKSDSRKASSALDSLTKSLERLQKATSKGMGGLSKTTDSLRKLNKILAEFDTRKMNRITTALQNLDSAKNVTISATLSKRLQNLADSIKNITHDDIDRIKDLINSLRDLGSIGDVNVPDIQTKKKKKDPEGVQPFDVSESLASSTSIIHAFGATLDTMSGSTQNAIVFLKELIMTAMDVSYGFDDIIDGTWQYVDSVEQLGSGTQETIAPLLEMNSAIGELGSGCEKSIVAVENVNTSLAKIGDTAEGQFGIVLSSGQELSKELLSIGQDSEETAQMFGESMSSMGVALNTLIDSVPILNVINEALRVIQIVVEAIKIAVTAIVYAIKIVKALIERIVDAIQRFWEKLKEVYAFFNKLLTPVKQVVSAFSKLVFTPILKTVTSPFRKFIDTVKNAVKGLRDFFNSIKRIAMYRLIRTALKLITDGLKDGIDNLYQYSKLMGGDFAKNMDKLATNALYIKNSIGAMVSPIINALAPAMDTVTDKIVGAIEAINMFISRLTGKDTYIAAKKLTKAYKEIKNATIGIDELNIIGDDVEDYANMFEELPIMSDVESFADNLREAFENGDWEELGTLLGEKVNEAIEKIDWEGIGEKIGYWLNGAIQTAYYFLDTINFVGLGSHVADLVNKVLESVDWEYFGRLMVKKITIIWDFVIGFIQELNFGQVAISLTNFILGVFNELLDWFRKWDWVELAKIFMDKVKDFFSNLNAKEIGLKAGEFLKTVFADFRTWIQNVDWGQVGIDLFETIRDFLANFDFPGVVKEFFSLLGSAAKAIKDLLKPFWDGIVDWWNEHIKGDTFLETIKNLGSYLVTFVDEYVLTPFMKAFFGEDWEGGNTGALGKLKEIGENLIEGVLKGIEDWVESNMREWIIKSIFGPFVWQICEVFGIASPAKAMIPYGENILFGLLEGMLIAMGAVGDWLKANVFEPIGRIISEWGKTIKELFTNLWEGFKEKATQIWNGIKETATTVWNFVKERALSVWDGIKEKATQIWGGIKERATTVWGNIKETAVTVWNTVRDTAGAVWEGIKTVGKGVWDTLSGAAKTVWEEVKTVGSTVWDTLKQKASDIWDNVKSFGSNAWDGIKSVATTVWDTVKSTANSMFSTIRSNNSDMSVKVTYTNTELKLPDGEKIVHIKYDDPGFQAPDGEKTIWVHYRDADGGYGHATGGIIPHYLGGIIPHASGGIVNDYTLFRYKNQIHSMGEMGREAILPLDSYTGWMDEIADRVNERIGNNDKDGISFEQALVNFYENCFEPVMAEIATDTKRQADKDERPIVKIGNRDIRTAYDTQIKADGYNFMR